MIKYECKKCGKRVYTGTIKIENGEQIFVCSHCEEKEEQLREEQQQTYPTLTENNWGLDILELQKRIAELERELKGSKMPTSPQWPWVTPVWPPWEITSNPTFSDRSGQ